MNYNAMVQAMGGEPEMIVRIESPLVRLYGDVAVASFVRLFNRGALLVRGPTAGGRGLVFDGFRSRE